jgi:hypothetical protein
MVEWTTPVGSTCEVLGYQLVMTNLASGDSEVVYDEPANQNVLRYLVPGLVPGDSYSFKVKSYSFNGLSLSWSDESTFESCTAPQDVQVPAIINRGEYFLEFSWSPPSFDGGCRVTSYQLYLENKDSGDMT